MPLKRQALSETNANAGSEPRSKRPKLMPEADQQLGSEPRSREAVDAAERAALAENAQPIQRSNRWYKISNSANVDMNYKEMTREPVQAYSYICLCKPPRLAREKSSQEKSSQEESSQAPLEEGESSSQPAPPQQQEAPEAPVSGCDFGETCLCRKPAADWPGHEWILSFAGYYKFGCQRVHAESRDPDNFGMRTFPHHAAYGAIEVLQNIFLDFEDARRARKWRDQWAILEATAMFLLSDWGACVGTLEDGQTLKLAATLVVRMVLSTFSSLEKRHLLSKNSEVKNVGLVMALYLKLAYTLRQQSAFDPAWWPPSQTEPTSAAQGRKVKLRDFSPAKFGSYVLTYATRNKVALCGVESLERYTSALDAYITMPKEAAKDDHWGWFSGFNEYLQLGVLSPAAIKTRPRMIIGGDVLDVTTWTSDERKMYSAEKQDPLTDEHISAVCGGAVLDIGYM